MSKYKHLMFPKFWVRSSLHNDISEGKFLPVSTKKEKASFTTEFWASDTLEIFEKNLREQGPDWYYAKNKVFYNINSENYRTQEFDKIDWANSIVIFGCSHVFGQGLDESDTLSSNIQKLTGINTVNMGVCGSSMMFSMGNQAILRTYYPKPKAVISLWPNIDRVTWFHAHTLDHLLPQHIVYNPKEDRDLIMAFTEDRYHPIIQAVLNRMTMIKMWEDYCPYYEGTTNLHDAESLDCDLINRDSKARDGSHPGREWSINAAKYIVERLNLCSDSQN